MEKHVFDIIPKIPTFEQNLRFNPALLLLNQTTPSPSRPLHQRHTITTLFIFH